MPRRPVKRLTSKFGGQATIDLEILDLILDLNSHGYRTRCSCAGDAYSTALITFEILRPRLSQEDIENIKDIVKAHTDVPFHVSRKSGRILFKRPLGNLPETEPVGGLAGWQLQLYEEVRPEDFPKELKKADQPGYWSERIKEEDLNG